MKTTNVLDLARKRQLARYRQATDEYRKLVRDYAADAELDPDSVIAILDANEKSCDDLAADADKHLARLGYAKLAAELPAITAELREIDEQFVKLNKEHEAIAQKMKAQALALMQRRNSRLTSLAIAQDADARLRNTCPDEALVAEERRLIELSINLHKQIQHHESFTLMGVSDGGSHTPASAVKAAEQELERGYSARLPKDRIARLQAALAQHKGELARHTAALQTLREQHAEVTKQLRILSDEKLLP